MKGNKKMELNSYLQEDLWRENNDEQNWGHFFLLDPHLFQLDPFT